MSELEPKQYLVIRNAVVVNVTVGDKPDGYKPDGDVFIPREGENAGAWIEWTDPGTGVLEPPPPPPEPAEED